MQSQDYVDIVKLTYNHSNLGSNATNFETKVDNFNFEFNYPKQINDKLILITGTSIEHTLLLSSETTNNQKLTMTRLNIGVKYQHAKKWFGTYLLLPKLATNFENIDSEDFQVGGLFVMDYKHSEATTWKIGTYSSTENFGIIISPFIGLWHRSKNKKLYINAALPVRFDVNYAPNNNCSFGADYLTSIKSYHLHDTSTTFYIQEEALRLAAYVAYGFYNNAVIVRGKIGLDSTDYGLYNTNDTLGVQLLNIPLQNDKRTRLNAEFDSGIFIGMDLIYRFDLSRTN